MFGFSKKDPRGMVRSIESTISSLEKDVFERFGLRGLPLGKKKEFFNKKTEAFFERILSLGIEKLDEKSKKEMGELIGDEVIPFLCSRVPDYDELVERESDRFRKEMTSQTYSPE